MLRKSVLILSVLCTAILIGCSTTETSNSNTSTDNSNKATTATTPATATTSTSSGDKVGIPECDDFIAKYDACVSNKVPEMVRAQYQTMLKNWRTEWKKAAENPQTRGTLAAACKKSAEDAATTMKTFNCTW